VSESSSPIAPSRSILVIEDEPTIADAVALRLRSEGFAVDIAADGPAGVEACDHLTPDLVVLDLMLPGLDGLEVCRRIQRARPVPVLMLTARDTEDDLVVGLATGADDYLTKPFSPRELALRVRSVLRRAPAPVGVSPVELTEGDLSVSTGSRSVTVKGESVSLTNREFELLVFFMTHADTVFSREQLLKQVWRWDFGDLSTVTVHVKRLRSKLGDEHRVQTVWGRGYLWSSDERPREEQTS
jgi:DNA-binding response OmpR family regulator